MVYALSTLPARYSWGCSDQFFTSDLKIFTIQHNYCHFCTQHLPYLTSPLRTAFASAVVAMPRYSYTPDSLRRLVSNACLRFWGLQPHSWQLDAVVKWLDQTIPSSPSFPTVNLLCRATGGGKSMTFKAFGSVTAGVILIVVPSLSLAADQVTKIKEAHDRTVSAVHLDDVQDSASVTKVKDTFASFDSDTDATVFLFASPQKIISSIWLPMIHGLIDRGALKAVFVDELQLFVQFGSYFRPEFPALREALFSRLIVRPLTVEDFAAETSSPESTDDTALDPTAIVNIHMRIPIVVMTATMDMTHLNLFTKMTELPVHPDNWLWARASEMQRRDIDLRFTYSSKFLNHFKRFCLEHFKDNDTSKVIVYSNSRTSIEKIQENFDTWLDEDEPFLGDSIAINGALFKEQKFYRANIFNETHDLEQAYENSTPCPRVGFFTAGTVGAGYDNPRIDGVYRQGFPMDRLSGVQEGGRNRGLGLYVLIASLGSYLYLVKRTHLPNTNDENTVRQDMEDVIPLQEQIRIQLTELHSFVRIVILDVGCWQVALEEFKGNPLVRNDDLVMCGDRCPRCRGEMEPSGNNIYKKVVKAGMIAFLVDIFITNPKGRVTPDSLIKSLHDYKDVGKTVYGRPRSSKPFSMATCEFNVFQLFMAKLVDITAEVETIKFGENNEKLRYNVHLFCKLNSDSDGNLRIHDDNAWSGMLLFDTKDDD